MNFFKQFNQFLLMGARAQAKWELDISNTILRDKKRIGILCLLLIPIFLGGIAFADDVGRRPARHSRRQNGLQPRPSTPPPSSLPPSWSASCAGLITGCIGAGGGFIIAPALMSAGVKGILAVGTDLFHIFAKAIMGSVLHRKLGNISVALAVAFLVGSIVGATLGGWINRDAVRDEPGVERRLHHHRLRLHAGLPVPSTP